MSETPSLALQQAQSYFRIRGPCLQTGNPGEALASRFSSPNLRLLLDVTELMSNRRDQSADVLSKI